MILKLQFPSCFNGPSGRGSGWALPIVRSEKENDLNTWENKVTWNGMFLVLIRQKRKRLAKGYFQAICYIKMTFKLRQNIYYCRLPVEVHLNSGQRAHALVMAQNKTPTILVVFIPYPHVIASSFWVPQDCFPGPGILLQMPCPLQKDLLLERADDDLRTS